MKVLIILLTTFSLQVLFAQDNTIRFTKDYQKRNDNKVSIEIPEVQELALIMMAITNHGLKDSNMFDHKSSYHQKVLDHFAQFKDHKAISIFDSLLNESIIHYILIFSNAYGFHFDGDRLVRTNVYTFPARGVGSVEINEDPILIYRSEIEDFAMKSGFRKFYKAHTSYYNSIVDDYTKFAAIDKQKKWLESKFDYKINSYRVLTSGLIGGINATQTFKNNNFKEMLLYLPIIKHHLHKDEDYNRALNSRVIFTEIDHNYVGPLSLIFKKNIDTIFDKRSVWVDSTYKSTDHYPNPIKVFDEYLTWGLFILYIMDTEPNNHSLLSKVRENVETKMNMKGFPKSTVFNEELIRIYRSKPYPKIRDIYKDLLTWSSSQ